MMTRNHRQEALCRAYIHAVAARCGMTTAVANSDYGVDLALNEIVSLNGRLTESGFKLDVQARSTVQVRIAETHIRYDLDRRAYETLRLPTTRNPRLLVLLVLPRDESLWTTQTEEQLILRHCAYWLWVAGRGAVGNRRSVRLTIPRTNVFSPDGVRELVRLFKSGAQP